MCRRQYDRRAVTVRRSRFHRCRRVFAGLSYCYYYYYCIKNIIISIAVLSYYNFNIIIIVIDLRPSIDHCAGVNRRRGRGGGRKNSKTIREAHDRLRRSTTVYAARSIIRARVRKVCGGPEYAGAPIMHWPYCHVIFVLVVYVHSNEKVYNIIRVTWHNVYIDMCMIWYNSVSRYLRETHYTQCTSANVQYTIRFNDNK